MIEKMKKMTFLVLSGRYDAFLEQLRSLGVVHVIQKQQGTVQNADLQQDIRLLGRCRTALRELSSYGDVSGRAMGYADVLAAYDSLLAEKAQLEQRLQQLSRESAQLEAWGDFEPSQIERLEAAGYDVRFYTCPLKAFREEWAEKYGAIEIFSDKQKIGFVTVTHAGTAVDIDAELCRLPQTSLGKVAAETEKVSAAIADIPSRMAALAADGGQALKDAVLDLENRIDFGRVRLTGESVAADSLLLLEGWIPAAQVEQVSSALEKADAFFDVSDPEPDDDIPIRLSNNRFAKLFEPLTKLYMLPTYQELDLTLLFAPFFMLFFGLCLGDMGYGLLMIVALPVFTKLFQLINPNFSKWLVVLFGASTMLCGTLSGTFFGFNIYDIDIPFIQKMKQLLYTDNSTMFTVSLCIGVVQILFGMGVKAVNLSIQCGFKSALSTIGWLVLLVTVGVCALAGIPFSSPVVIALLAIACVGIFLLNSPGQNIFLNIGLGLWDTYNMATGLLGDVLSYVRLFALGLSGGILANVFNSMAVGMKPDNPVAGFIVMALIFVIGHALNIFMNILGAIVHPMRLTFVEFFKNAGYTGGGTEYRPFSRKTEIAE